jgi:hypothetical protein
MGKVTTPMYRLEAFVRTPKGDIKKETWSWNARKAPAQGIHESDGTPSPENIEKAIIKIAKSYEIGGSNEHYSKALGYMPIPFKARVIHQKSQSIMAEWHQPTFWCI